MIKTDSRAVVDRHFLAQDERPGALAEVEIETLDPFLRGLLFTDGTVTRALAVQMLRTVSVERVGQEWVPVPAGAAGHLEIEAGEESVRRRVRIGFGAAAPALWAESHLIPERLPPGFMGLLDGAPDGIGQSLQRVALESYRELLWLGHGAAPGWAEPDAAAVGAIHRLYRIVSGGQVGILISESFAVEAADGVVRLAVGAP